VAVVDSWFAAGLDVAATALVAAAAASTDDDDTVDDDNKVTRATVSPA